MLFFILSLSLINKLEAQCDALITPQLFGPSSNSVFCKNGTIPIGVTTSDTIGTDQFYYFSKYVNGTEVSRKGGPLVGNGGQLSVSATMRSAGDAGEYRVTTGNACGVTSFSNFYVFYGGIDNLSISAWGGNAVTFRWTPCGPSPAVITYEYAVTTSATPPASGTLTNPSDTFATVSSGLTAGNTYYIHVRLSSIVLDGDPVDQANFGSNCSGGVYPWSSIRFVSCAGAASIGTLTPVNPVSCAGGSTTLTATGGTSYRWYKDNDTAAIFTGSPTYSPTVPAQYRSWITTSAGCRGMVKTTTYTQVPSQTGLFFGGGDFYSGDTVRLGLNNTVAGQVYKILKDGVEVYSMPGIGDPNESDTPDSIWYKFEITSASQAGHYTVRTTPSLCSTVDFGDVTVNLITGVTICPNASTSFNFLSVGANTTYHWQVDNGSGFTNISDNTIYSGTATKILTINTNTTSTSMYGYKYRCVATVPGSVTSSARTLLLGVTWVGAAPTGSKTAWANAANWSCAVIPGVAPNANIDVIIPSTTNKPVLSAPVSCKSVLVKTGGMLTVNPGIILTLTGH